MRALKHPPPSLEMRLQRGRCWHTAGAGWPCKELSQGARADAAGLGFYSCLSVPPASFSKSRIPTTVVPTPPHPTLSWGSTSGYPAKSPQPSELSINICCMNFTPADCPHPLQERHRIESPHAVRWKMTHIAEGGRDRDQELAVNSP